jgi:REase_AHJR-like
MDAETSREKQRARAIAEEYRSRGYEVIEEPSPEQLPGFLSGYRPDLLVRRGDEAIIVEVKSRSSLAKDPRIRKLARLLQTKPHWNFELVMVGEAEGLIAPEGARPFERDDVLRGIEAAERLLESGFSEAALLLAWSTSEATVRLLTEEEGVVLDRLNPLEILKQAVSNGVISRDDYNFLTNVMRYRNALVHGFKTIDFDPALVSELINVTKRLLHLTSAP